VSYISHGAESLSTGRAMPRWAARRSRARSLSGPIRHNPDLRRRHHQIPGSIQIGRALVSDMNQLLDVLALGQAVVVRPASVATRMSYLTWHLCGSRPEPKHGGAALARGLQVTGNRRFLRSAPSRRLTRQPLAVRHEGVPP